MGELRKLGHEVIDGGGGGNFLRTCLFKWKPDILHLHWPHPYMIKSSLIGSWLRSCRLIMELKIIQMTGTKLVWTVHNLVSHDSRYPHTEKYFLRKLSNLVDRIIIHEKSAIQVVSEHLTIRNPEIISVIPHGNYIGYYPDNVTREQARSELNLKPGALVLLFIGQIRPYKGVSELISAFKRLNSDNLELIIAGAVTSQNLLEELNNMISGDSRIRFYPGYIEDNKLQYYFRVADLVVLPYKNVLTSSSLVLAMGFDCCCLVPDLGILAETVGHDAGFVYDPKTHGSFQNELENIFKNTWSFHEKGVIARKRVEMWSFNDAANITDKIYHEALLN